MRLRGGLWLGFLEVVGEKEFGLFYVLMLPFHAVICAPFSGICHESYPLFAQQQARDAE